MSAGEAVLDFIEGSVIVALLGFVLIAVLATLGPVLPSEGPFAQSLDSTLDGFVKALALFSIGGVLILVLRLRGRQ